MGIEYEIIGTDSDKDILNQALEKVLSDFREFVVFEKKDELHLTFNDSNEMPDVFIYVEATKLIFIYNGGYSKAWSVFGMLVSYIAQWCGSVTINEL